MLLLTACLGDTIATLVEIHPINVLGEELFEKGVYYNLTFSDITSNKTFTYRIDGENNAILTFASWLAADEEDYAELSKARDALYDSPARDFMP